MEKKTPALEKLHELYLSGQVETATEGYLAFLAEHPHNAEALHALGLLSVEQNRLAEAADYFTTAIDCQPNNPTLQLHLANVLKRQGLFNRATEVLQNTVLQHPHYAPAFNNLGTLSFAQGKFAEAIHFYQLALEKQPLYIDAYYNLGLALIKTEKLDAALLAFQKIIDTVPEHAAACFQQACVFMQQEKWDHAINNFLTLEKKHPFHLETQINFATCYLRKGAFDEAKLHYLKALELSPTDQQILFNLGYLSTQQGQLNEAIRYYQGILQLDPLNFSAHNNLGTLYISQRHTTLALEHFQKALAAQPNNAAIDHIIKILKKDPQLLASPPAYLKALFDYYAAHYETHLLEVLAYRVPQVLMDALEKAQCLPAHKITILDLGCGTGLCGVALKPFAAELVGIDLSPQMLKIAAEKQLYDLLIEEDFVTFLSRQKACYDLIVAGDALVYNGDLSQVFHYLKAALRPQGLLVFNTEITEKADFLINPTGRFAHHREYLDKLLINNQLKLIHYSTAQTRLQNDEAVHGHIYVVQAP
jgi:predicted TPR repeat methyltransferase